MDIALKQRLVGAMVIVALGVIFIPMLLDGPPEGERRELAMEIPDPPEQRVETRRLPVDPTRTTTTREEERSAPRRDPPSRARLRESSPAPAPATQERPAPGEGTTATASRNLPADASPAPTGNPEAGATAPTPRPPVRRLPPDSRSEPSGQWLLQLGSFSRSENATRLVASLQEAGIPAWSDVVEVSGRTLHRVRAGGWDTRQSAMDAAARVGELVPDLEVSLRQRTGGTTADEDSAVEPDSRFGWMVQAGVFTSAGNATALRDRLRGAGLVASVQSFAAADGTRYRVRVGPEIDRQDAEAVLARLRSEFGISGLIVTHP